MGQAVFENCTPELQKEYWKKDNRKEWENIGYIGNMLSEADAKSAIGNGWTVDVIAHILHNIKTK